MSWRAAVFYRLGCRVGLLRGFMLQSDLSALVGARHDHDGFVSDVGVETSGGLDRYDRVLLAVSGTVDTSFGRR